MIEHSSDLLTLMIWAFSTLGALMVGGAGWGLIKVLERLDSQDTTLQSIRNLLQGTEGKLVDMIHAHDIRLTVIEGHCGLTNNADSLMRRYAEHSHAGFPDYPAHE